MFRDLKASEIEVRVGNVAKDKVSWFTLLLYKNARCDMAILDETFGAMNWECDYKDVKGNLYCGIGIRMNDSDFVWKWDCGIESKENEGNEKKGEASDAFKRAGFKWGIGRELYTAPFIYIPDNPQNYKGLYVSDIEIKDKQIVSLTIKDSKHRVVYTNNKNQAVEREEQCGLNNLSSASENALESNVDAKKTVYKFKSGKYENKTINEVAETDPEYLKSLLNQNITKQLRLEILKALRMGIEI